MNLRGIIVFVIVLIVCVVGVLWYKNKTFNNILKCLKEMNYQGVLNIIDSFGCKTFFAPFNREEIRLNAFFLMGDSEKISEQFDLLLNMRINKKQKMDVVVKAFYFYVDEKNQEKALQVLNKIKALNDEALTSECELLYDIMLLKKTDYVDMMEDYVKTAKAGFDRGMFHYLLAVQYGYLDNKKKQVEHLRVAKKDMKDTPYEIKIKQMLNEK